MVGWHSMHMNLGKQTLGDGEDQGDSAHQVCSAVHRVEKVRHDLSTEQQQNASVNPKFLMYPFQSSPLVTINLFFMSVSLFLFCR